MTFARTSKMLFAALALSAFSAPLFLGSAPAAAAQPGEASAPVWVGGAAGAVPMDDEPSPDDGITCKLRCGWDLNTCIDSCKRGCTMDEECVQRCKNEDEACRKKC